jgi:3-(3-hydroxy-phenyl)propionate hydroxylase
MAFPGSDPVIVAGAGPVGGTLALYLAREGFDVVLLEKCAELPEDLRASTFHPPSLDMLDRLGLTKRLIELGLVVPKYQFRDRRSGDYAEFDLKVLAGETNHPYRLQCEQWRLNQICVEELRKIPNAKVLFSHGVVDVSQDGDGVTVAVESPEGRKSLRGSYVIGAEGANSQVRQKSGLEYEGFTYPEKFLVASTRYPLEIFLKNIAGVNYIADPEEWCIVLRCNNLWRVLFPTKPGTDDKVLLSDAYIQAEMHKVAPKQGDFHIGHRTLYNVHQRVASTYRKGRVLLAGDAAHINNPIGGMGMNGGLHDAFNLAEKFIAIRDGKADDSALDLYDRQRRLTATKFVQEHTINNKKMLEDKDPNAAKKRLEMLKRTADDPKLSFDFLVRTTMISVVRESYEIA